MATPGAGFQYPAQAVSWTKRDVLLFANSIGCAADELQYLYELHPNFQVFPTYAIILPFKGTQADVIDFYANQDRVPIPDVPKFDSRRVVDGQRKLEFLRPLPTSSAGRSFEVQSTVLGVYDKGKPGSVVETQTELRDASSGEVYTRAVGSAFFTGQGGWGGPKGDKAPTYDPPKDRAPDAVHEFQTTAETALLYRLNGDYNPLHADPAPGAKMGFGGAIMHGLWSWNNAAHAVVKAFGKGDGGNLKEFQCRFASPVKPGDKLVTEMWKVGSEEIRFVTKVVGGKVCLSGGRALVKNAAASKL